MSLTPEERRRIYEEEKARLEAQQQLRAQLSPPPKKKGGGFLMGCLVVIGVLLLLGIIGTQSRPHSAIPTASESQVSPSSKHATLKVIITKNEIPSYGDDLKDHHHRDVGYRTGPEPWFWEVQEMATCAACCDCLAITPRCVVAKGGAPG
jgi:hypothetical protein